MSGIKAGDTHTITLTVSEPDGTPAGTPVDLTGSTPRVVARPIGDGDPIELESSLGTDLGTVLHTLTGTLPAGAYHIEVEMTASDGAITRAPSEGYAVLRIVPTLD